jgi:hypothetical protein
VYFTTEVNIYRREQKSKSMENRKEYYELMIARLAVLDNEIQKLEGMTDRAVEEVKDEYRQQIEELFLKKEAVEHKLLKIRNASGNAWEDMKAGVDLSWEVFHDSVKKAFRKIK